MDAKVLIPVAIIIVVLLVDSYIVKYSHYECPECHQNFQVSFWQYVFQPHYFGEREQTCPYCGYVGLLRLYRGKS